MNECFREFEQYKFNKRTRITTMDTILRNNDEFKESEIDVLLRGYIVLIYAFWEGNYKKLQDTFFEFFSQKKVSQVPEHIKKILVIDLSISRNEKKYTLLQLRSFTRIKEINDIIDNILDLKLSECSKYSEIKGYFYEFSNNPNYDKLKKLLSKYSMFLDKIVNSLKLDNSLSNNFKQILEFIIDSRNAIAHGSETLGRHNGYKEYIQERFFDGQDKTVEEISGFLRDISFNIDVLFTSIVDEFKYMYMHEEEMVV